ncbi:MAG: hypothetical protein ABIN36_10920 [Ferruginibacter sp.]
MKKYFILIILLTAFTICDAQYHNKDTALFTIINNEEVISNEMIFYSPADFPKNKKPLFLINGNEVETIAYYYDHDDFKKITVLQPAEGLVKFGKKGKYGVIMLELKDEVKEPYIEIVSNKIYYSCRINEKLIDTTKEYADRVNGNDCTILDLTGNSGEYYIYANFDNKIKIRQLGVGWDRVTLFISGGTISGYGNERLIRTQKEGNLKFVINANGMEKVIILKAVSLPSVKSY